MQSNNLNLPDIITLNHFGGDFHLFLNAVYEIFINDFINNRPYYNGKRLRLKKIPYIDGRECTFYHFTHDGDVEKERLPNLRRMERIAWPSPMINNSNHPDLLVWRNKRGTDNRILIYHSSECYLVVLADRGDYILPWTAYLVENTHSQRKLIKEYDTYIKTKTAQGG